MRWSISKLIFRIIGLIFLVLIAAYLLSWYQFLRTPVIPDGENVHYILPAGGNITQIANDLSKRGYLKKPIDLIVLAKVTGDISKLKAGEYLLPGPLTPLQLLKRFTHGEVVIHQIMIMEGWTFHQMLYALARAPYLKHELTGTTYTEVMAKLNLPNGYPEGLFFPSTYQYIWGTSDIDILKRAYKTMQRKLNSAWLSRAPNLLYQNPYQALIVASMVEKETGLVRERPLVAGVILKRLEKNMPLQIDPTVIYGLGAQYNGLITRTGLEADTPYNTYKYRGLPPTPIALPSLSAITAALHPQISDALFYVATGVGGHYFSATLQQHDDAIKKYHAYEDYLRSKATLPLVKASSIASGACRYFSPKLLFLCTAHKYD